MKNRWSENAAKAFVEKSAKDGVDGELALRLYTTRLLGDDPALVLHGGGNTSLKTTAKDSDGRSVSVLHIKGSGRDMAEIEASGMPAVRLDPLAALIERRRLADAEMIQALRGNLIDPAAPGPSVETLLHAFLPHRYVDHTHANAVLSLGNQPDGERLCREVLGERVVVIPYVMSGFKLAKQAAMAMRAAPNAEALVILRHGIFSVGDTAKQAYSRMIRTVGRAEKRLKQGTRQPFVQVKLPKALASLAEVAPVLRGLLAEHGFPMILDARTSKPIRAFVGGRDLARYSQSGTATPDHVIRTKAKPLIVPPPLTGGLDKFRDAAETALNAYIADYNGTFKRHNRRGTNIALDPLPRVILVPGLGLIGLGQSPRAAAIAADLAECAVDVIGRAEAVGRFEGASEKDLFDIEYWMPEQAKLNAATPLPLAGQVTVVTGGGSGIGAAIARAFAEAGSAVAVLDRDGDAAEVTAESVHGLGLACDVTDADQVNAAIARVAAHFGGVDIAISNAGAAWQGRIGDVDQAILRKSFELNFWGHQNLAQAAVRVMRAQGVGGCLLFNTSKQAINPGKNFGPYGLAKAATLFLMKQYALDHGSDGIRSNAVNADRIRSGLLTAEMIASRSKSRGLSESDYMAGNLLGREVTAEDVAAAFLHLALAPATTAAVLTVDGGNIEASLR